MTKEKQEEERKGREKHKGKEIITKESSEKGEIKKEGKQGDEIGKISEKEVSKENKKKIKPKESVSILKKETKDLTEPSQVEPPQIKSLKKYSLLPELMKELPSLSYSETKDPIPISESSSFNLEIPSVDQMNPLPKREKIETIKFTKSYQHRLVVPEINSGQIKQPSLIPHPSEEKVLEETSVEEASTTTGDKIKTEGRGKSGEPNMGKSPLGFDLIDDEHEWVTSSSLSLTESGELIYIEGVDGMGFKALRGLLVLELLDRGRKPFEARLEFTNLDPQEVGKISDDQMDYYNIVWLTDSLKSLETLIEKNERVQKVKEEIDRSLKKHILKYIVIANKIGKKGSPISEPKDLESISQRKNKIYSKFSKIFGPFEHIILKYCQPGEERKLSFEPLDNKNVTEKVFKTFLRILQINKPPFSESDILWSSEMTIDQLWSELWQYRKEGIDKLQDKYAQEKKIRRFIPPSAKQDNESAEHFVMKQMIVKNLIEKEWFKTIQERDGIDYKTEWNKKSAEDQRNPEPIEVESWKLRETAGDGEENRKVIKKPDLITLNENREEIWIEAETCKALESPLDHIKKKIRILSEIEDYTPPKEIWLVFPYKKYVTYGKNNFEQRFRQFFEKLRKKNKIEELKPRIFFTDFYNERLLELSKGS